MPARLDDGPPPSTYAAQIVHNLENTKERSQLSGSRTQLAQLFRAVLALDTNDLTDDETFETNLAINHRLIWTIIKGCLCLQGNANPFDSLGEVIELARDGLAVILVTVRRYPEVVFTSLAKDTTYAAPEGPLFVWVVPRLLTLLHQNNDTVIRDGARNLLCKMLEIKSAPRIAKFRKRPILRYVRDCVDDILDFLVQLDVSHISDTAFNLPLIPSINTIREACGQELLKVVSHVEADNPVQALSIAVACLWIVTEYFNGLPLSTSLPSLRWVVGCLITSRPLFVRIDSSSQDQNELSGLFLKTVNAALMQISQSIQDSVESNQLLQLLCLTVADILRPFERDQTLVLNSSLQNTLCSSLYILCLCCNDDIAAWRTYNQYLESALQAVLEDHILCLFEEDLQASILLRFTFRFATEEMEEFPIHDFPSCNEAIQNKLAQLFNQAGPGKRRIAMQPPAKRQCNAEASSLISSTASPEFRTIYLETVRLPQDTSASLPQIISETLAELPETVQRDMIRAAGIEACKLSNSVSNSECQICAGDEAQDNARSMDSIQSTSLGDILVSIIRIVQEQKSPSPRVQAMLALRRFLAHCSNTEYIDLRTSTLATWPLQSLKSSIRSLRIAAISAIVHLISGPISQTILRANRVSTLDVLRSLSDRDVTLQEISVIAHGRIASIIHSEDEINLCLLRLVEFLGHSNSFIANLAYEELQQLCSHSNSAAMRLFEPYWRTLATIIVKDLRNRPQICQMVCDLLGISIGHFLKLTQFHTIPFLILRKQTEVLRRIAEANGPNMTLLDICSNSEQLAVILAYILLQPSENPEETIRSLLSQVSDDFASIDPQDLLRSDPTRIAFELLQVASSDLAETKARARHGILILAEKTQRKPNKKYSAADIFFEESSLGIIQLLSEVVSQTKGAQPIGNRRRCVRAIEEMAIIAGYHLINALPQISACLRSAIEDEDLCNDAFGAWMTLINSIDSEDAIGTMVDPTFAIVAQHWNSFSTEIQQLAHDLISALIKNHSDWIRENVLSIPSLEGIPLLAKFESELNNFRDKTDPRYRLEAFGDRCRNDNATIVRQALNELPAYLLEVQPFIYNSVVSEQPDPSIGYLVKALLDACVRFANKKEEIAREAARCLGLIGCLDPTKIELPHGEREIFVLSDFVNPDETLEFAIFFLEEVLVKTFLAETDTRAQGLLAYAIQELLKTCGFEPKNTINKNLQPDRLYQRWRNMDEAVRDTLAPFLTSRYVLEPLANAPDCGYPIYSEGMNHSIWLRQIVFDLLGKSVGKNAQIIFSICRRIVRRQNIAIPAFLLPFITLHIIFQGTAEQIEQLSKEFLAILATPLPTNQAANENLILCSQDVFRTLDYMSRWLQERKKTKEYWPRIGVASVEEAQQQEISKLEPIEKFLSIIPAEIISDRAVQCKNFSRAILHWEVHIREKRKDLTVSQQDMDKMYSKLQNIYNSIDEPDGIEGISPLISDLPFEQQMLENKKAGRWNALQGWYEVELNKHPEKQELQTEFLRTLKETGQYDTLINEFTALRTAETSIASIAELVIEAAWNTSRYAVLSTTLASLAENHDTNFNVGIGRILTMLQDSKMEESHTTLDKLRIDAVRHLSTANIKSIQTCHDIMLRFQILSEVEELAEISVADPASMQSNFRTTLLQRVERLGAFPSEQQKLLSIQRAVVDVRKLNPEIWGRSTSWLRTAKLARQSHFIQYAFNAVFRACDGEEPDMAYAIEDARLLWLEGHHIKAIQSLRAAIEGGTFGHPSTEEVLESRKKGHASGKLNQNPLLARAHLLLAKWIDHAGQTQSETIIEQYRTAVDLHNRSEKGHYHLGRHYNKLLESEKIKPPAKQAQNYITGEMAKLVIENFLRSMAMGAKYVHQTLPRILTLWLELGNDVKRSIDASYGNDANFQRHIESQRQKIFKLVMTQMKKYIDRLPAYVFYTAFSQVLARICHPNELICSSLVDIVARVVVAHPQQAMWSLLALIKSKKQENRIQRGKECWAKVQDNAKKLSEEAQRLEIVNLMKQGQRLSDQLLSLSNKDLGKRHGTVSLSNDLGFSHSRSSHCRLAIPVEAMLTANLPTPKEIVRGHKAFPKDTITIDTFLDEVLVLNSLIKPKKVTIRGSNGRIYGILCKPKDDLRKDQRLLEFNSMITRLLKRDAQSSKRRLYIKTYAVTPLNEECGLIEWVEGVRPLRDILLDIYRQRNVRTDYGAIKEILDAITANKDEVGRFDTEVLNGFPPVFHAWFTEMFPEPSAWFEARLRYTRSCAVMSMVGHVLGLGDRHGENILFQGENGGTLHVDFNCLFDKGLTFEKPERVPFRLTHNMVDAFGIYGYEGPFRKCCELSLGILRQHEHALMTILETFVHDPTTDFIGKKRKANPIVPDTPEGVLEAIRNKVRGLIAGESVPLSVEGHVQLLIQEATDPYNLAAMYIGWCAFL